MGDGDGGRLDHSHGDPGSGLTLPCKTHICILSLRTYRDVVRYGVRSTYVNAVGNAEMRSARIGSYTVEMTYSTAPPSRSCGCLGTRAK